MQARYEVADILKEYGQSFKQEQKLPGHHLRTLKALEQCRTAALGGHKDACQGCGAVRISYNSCRNRHCPKCQNTNREQWLMDREAELLPVPYFHIVFTLPDALNKLCMHHPKAMYGMLFKAAWQTIEGFGWHPKFLGAETGMIAILHTWGQNLSLHPHLHCIIPGGGISATGKWKKARNNGKWLFPVKDKGMSEVFRAKYIALLRQWAKKEKVILEPEVIKKCFDHNWVVYAKQAFNGPKGVMEYLGRYSHKIAISNHRLLSIQNGKVAFKWKDYRTLKNGVMELSTHEFLRRFCLHILPKGFPRIRHYGFLASRSKADKLKLARTAIGVLAQPKKEKHTWQELSRNRLGFDPELCPHCGNRMKEIERWLPERAPPIKKIKQCL